MIRKKWIITTRHNALIFQPESHVGNKCWIDIKMMSTVDGSFCDGNCQHQIDINCWHQQNLFQPRFFFIKYFCQWSFSGHIVHILTSCVDVHMIIAILHQEVVKIRPIDVPRDWPNFDFKWRFKCTLCIYLLFVRLLIHVTQRKQLVITCL